MTKVTLTLKTSTVQRLKEESRRRDPDNSRKPVGPVIDALVEEYLTTPIEKPKQRKGGAK